MTLPFVFVVSNVPSTPFAKSEVLARHPRLRFAFSRPGLVTFRADDADVSFGAELVFARVAGRSLGKSDDASGVVPLVPAEAACVHVFPRDPEDVASTARTLEVAGALREALAGRVDVSSPPSDGTPASRRAPRDGELVVDVVVAHGEPLFVGAHRHGRGRSPIAGALPGVVVPPASPSRAFAKLEEALAWSGYAFPRGTEVVELGAAPGGATLACLLRGWPVTAVDPADLDAGVLAFVGPGGARARHVQKPAGALEKRDVPPDARVLLSDMNLAPPVALRYIRRAKSLMPALSACVLTLKLNDEKMLASAPELVEAVRELGLVDVAATQLPSHRQEMVVVGRVR